jgi:hypothetical protein
MILERSSIKAFTCFPCHQAILAMGDKSLRTCASVIHVFGECFGFILFSGLDWGRNS